MTHLVFLSIWIYYLQHTSLQSTNSQFTHPSSQYQYIHYSKAYALVFSLTEYLTVICRKLQKWKKKQTITKLFVELIFPRIFEKQSSSVYIEKLIKTQNHHLISFPKGHCSLHLFCKKRNSVGLSFAFFLLQSFTYLLKKTNKQTKTYGKSICQQTQENILNSIIIFHLKKII